MKIQGVVDRISRLHNFLYGFGAPVTGITPSTQVGRLSGSHSDIGFQLTQFPRREKEGEGNGRVKKSAQLYC